MFFPESRVRVYLYGQPVDMRKSFDGLYAVARAAFPQDPTGGDLYAFVNRSGTQIKVLYFDRSGWCVWAKRLEAGRFIGDWSKVHTHEIDCTRLKLLLEGIEPRRQLKRYRHHPGPDDRRSDRCNPATHGNSEHSHGEATRGCVA
jgi:transposase